MTANASGQAVPATVEWETAITRLGAIGATAEHLHALADCVAAGVTLRMLRVLADVTLSPGGHL